MPGNSIIFSVFLGTHGGPNGRIVAGMRPYSARASAVKWYHIIWSTYRRRRVFKIPALRRFCEQSIQLRCAHSTWRIERAAVSANRVRLLVCASARVPRQVLLHDLKRSVASVIRETGMIRRPRRAWDDGGWCATLNSGTGIDVVRRDLERVSANGAWRSLGDGRAPVTLQYASSARAASMMSEVWGST